MPPQRPIQHTRLHAITVDVEGIGILSFPYIGSPLLFARSTGLKVWPACKALANLMADEKNLVEEIKEIQPSDGFLGWQGLHVIELGCGLAVLSIVASRQGATISLATDGDPDLIYVAKKNIKHIVGESKGLTAHVLPWGDRQAVDQCLEICQGRVDVVVLSDVIYGSDASVWDKLINTISSLKPQFVLQAETRRIEGLLYDMYWEELESRGFCFKILKDDGDDQVKMWVMWKEFNSNLI